VIDRDPRGIGWLVIGGERAVEEDEKLGSQRQARVHNTSAIYRQLRALAPAVPEPTAHPKLCAELLRVSVTARWRGVGENDDGANHHCAEG
jgi:hypothetical protein